MKTNIINYFIIILLILFVITIITTCTITPISDIIDGQIIIDTLSVDTFNFNIYI